MPKFRQIQSSTGGEVREKLHRQPCSPATNLIHTVIEAGRDGLYEMPKRLNMVNHSQKLKITIEERSGLMNKGKKGQKDLQIEFKNSCGYIILEMPSDIFDTVTGQRKSNVKKIFQFVLEQVEAQAFRGGELTQETVTFSGNDLVSVGIYDEQITAKRGFDAAMSILTSIKVRGEIRYSPKMKPIYIHSLSVIFPRTEYEDDDFTVFLNQNIDWNFIIHFFSHIPEYYYELSSRAASLAYQIFYLARQHTKGIKEDGSFTISLKAVRNALSIPLKATKHAKRDIIEEFFRAADEVEAAHEAHFHNSELEIFFLNCSDKMTPDEFISAVNKGVAVLQVCMSGELAKPFIDFETQKEIKKDKAIKKARAAKKAREAKKDKASA